MNLALWLKRNRYRADQVQTFLPSPMAPATAMYHTGVNPLRRVRRGGGEMVVLGQGACSSAACTRRSCAITTPRTGRCCATR